jgi:hypothetical protein
MNHARLLGGADWDESLDGGFSTIDKRYGSFLYSLKTAQTLIEVSHKNDIYIGFGRCERVRELY